MLRNLSPHERATLLMLGDRGPGGDFDQLAMGKLFVMHLVEVNPDRRLALTALGRQYYDAIVAEGAMSDGQPK